MKKSFLYIVFIFTILICNIAKSEIYPSSGENGKFYKPGEEMTITWDLMDFNGQINIYLWDGQRLKFDTLAESIESVNRTFTWNIPFNYPVGKYFRLKIVEKLNPNVYKMSKSFFTINFSQLLKQTAKSQTPDNINITLFPNPASDFITIQFSNKRIQPFAESDKVQIFDILGIEIKDLPPALSINGEGVRIDISHLPAGVYFMKIGGMIEKFVKM